MTAGMRAILYHESGGPEVLREESIPQPEIQPDEVLVKVMASSVNPVDTKIRSGMLAAIAPEPAVLGCDVAGVVAAVGSAVRDFQLGDRVYGCAGGLKGRPGALAEYMACEAALLAPAPPELSWEEAAALPLVCITAWEGLVDRAGVCAGQRVLIHGGAGGVGHVAVQICKARGAEVWATVSSTEKAAVARSLGADGVIFYREEEVGTYVDRVTGGAGFDIVFDTVGGENVARCFQAARVSGTVVSISTRTTADLSPLHAKGLSLHVVFMLIPMLYRQPEGCARQGGILRKCNELVAAGQLRPLLDTERFAFSQAAAAHARLQSGAAMGKVVLTGFHGA